ncbi:MAG: Ig-like domain-containing protein [Pseudomonadota bacterium]
MTAISYVARAGTGSVNRGEVSSGESVSPIWAGGGQEISLNLRQIDVRAYNRAGQTLEITLADGRVVVLEGYFGDDGAAQSRLFVSADGYIAEVELVEGADGTLYAQYGPTEVWGKWSPSDDLIFLDGSEVANATAAAPEVSMLGAGALGGAGLLGLAGAGAAAVGVATVVGDDDEGGGGPGPNGPTRIEPTVNETGTVTIGGDDVDPQSETITITGTADPDSTVVVVIGDEQVETAADDQGTWEVTFEGDDFPDDGAYEVVVTVTETDGMVTVLDGPDVTIDTTPPDTFVLDGTVDAGDVINAEEYEQGIEISGTGETGSTIEVTVEGVTHSTVVNSSGEWSVTYVAGELPTGEYTTEVTVVASDILGNTTTLSEQLEIDTVPHPLEVDTDRVEGDGVINAAERSDGFAITGTSTPGAVVEVTIQGVTQSVITSSSGTWVANFDAGDLPQGTYQAEVTATTVDAAGNPSSTSGTIQVDTEAQVSITSQHGGADGAINQVESQSGLAVTGTTEPGSTVVVQLGAQSVTAVVGADGTWTASFTAAQIPAGTYTTSLTATTTDAAGNTETATQSVAVDTDAGTLTLNASAIGGDGMVNAAEAAAGVLVTGTADPNAVVSVSFGGVEHTVQADAAGNWRTTYASSEIPGGDYAAPVSASVIDAAGNSRSVQATMQVDTIVENLSLSDLNVAIGTDGSDVINAQVAAAGFPVTGTIEPGSTVTVTIGGVARVANVDANGNWTANFLPGDVTGGEYMADITIDVVDGAGNPASLADTVRVDTLVNTLSQDSAPVEGDDVINAAEAADGVTVTGQVEPGSVVQVQVFGQAYSAVVASNGAWTLDIPAADIPLTEQTFNMVVTATDSAGNTSSITESLSVDAVAPDDPDIVGYFREGGGYRNVTLETSGDDIDVHQVSPGGGVSQLSLFENENAFLGETDYFFTDAGGAPTTIPDGSQLVVTSTDDAGNTSSTYLVLDETNTNTVDAGNPNLSQFQIETIDLRFGDQSQLSLTEEQVLALSDNSDQVVVRGGADDNVTITGAQRTGSTVLDGEGYDIYTLGDDATVVVDEDINVIGSVA